ncbi:MAG: DUF2752 domain-containing protein [Oscillospiraceae bacterium]|nr:DUF2752 domain-containing protein [Oscillospiraceae bacterium]
MKRIFRHTIVWLPPLLIAAAFILRKYIWAFVTVFSNNVTMCHFYEKTGIMCPGCGGTRSFIALAGGDILTSFRCNPSVIIGLTLLFMLYIELSAESFGKHIKLIPRSKVLWILAGIIFAAWCIARNFVPFLQP